MACVSYRQRQEKDGPRGRRRKEVRAGSESFLSVSPWMSALENAFVCLRAHARTYSGAAKTHTAEQHGSPQRGSRDSSHN